MTGKFAGRRFGRYELLNCLGAGGMGEVYRARDTRLDREVAIKVIHTGKDTEEAAKRLEREANTLSKLNHPNIASIYDFDREGDIGFVVMELIDGETLHDRIRSGSMEEHDVLNIGMQIASGLSDAHEHGVVHRDLKPGNIMITPKGQVKLLDFGLARRVQTNVTVTATSSQTSNISGTFPYMAPEQLRNAPVGPFTDIWAFGAVLYELTTGRRPFGGDDIASIVDGVLNQTPEPPSAVRGSISPGLSFIIQKALSKAPTARYQSAAEIGAALQALRSGSSIGSGFAAVRRRSSPWVLRVAALAAILAVVTAGWLVWTPRPAPAPSAGAGSKLAVLVGGVENRTDDPAFDDLLPELLATTLEQSRAVEVYPRSNLGFVLRRMQRDPVTRIDETIGREICQREGLSAVVLQSITRLGDSFVLVVRAVMPDGRLMASTQATMTGAAELPARMDAIGRTMRQALGESAATVAQSSVRLEEVTSKSLEAVQFYSRGRQRLYAGDPRGAITFLERAIAIDPEFAMAHGGLGTAYTNLFDLVRAEQHFRLAASFAARAPEIEREKLLGDFEMVRRNYDAACPHFEVLTSLRPREASPFLMLGYCSALKLDLTTAVMATEKAYAIQPSPRTQTNRALVTFLSGNAAAAAEQADALRKAVPGLMQAGHLAGISRLALGQFDQAHNIYQAMVAQGGDALIDGHLGLADFSRSTGRLAEARTHLQQAHRAAAERGNLSASTTAAAERAELALFEERPHEYRAAIALFGRIPADVYLAYRIGRARARGGLTTEAQEAIRAIEGLSTGSARQHEALKALLRAEIALARSQPDLARQEAAAAMGFEPSTIAHETLARALAALGRGAEAATSYEYIVAHPEQRCESYDVQACYRTVDALYWAGRLKDEAGNREDAVRLLKRFVSAWSGAPASPFLTDAMKRLSRLP